MLLEYWEAKHERNRATVYACRFPQLCVNKRRRPVACSRDYVEFTRTFTRANASSPNRACLDSRGDRISLPKPSDQEWCATGGQVDLPLCESPITASTGRGYFSLNTNYLRCPADSKWGRALFTAATWLFMFGLFIAINEFVRPHYPVLDIVLDSYQTLGLITNTWLAWPERLSFLFTIYNIALFDVDVLSPQCSLPDWGYQHAFGLMLLSPICYCLCKLALAVGRGWLSGESLDQDSAMWNRTIGECLSFILGAQPSLVAYSIGTFTQRRIEGFGIVLAESPGTKAHTDVIQLCRAAAVIVLTLVVVLPPIIAGHLLVLYRQNKLMQPWCLARYGFMYADFRSHSLYWGVVRLARTAFLAFVGTLLWKHPRSQAVAAICCLLVSLSAQARVRPYLNDVQNRFEKWSNIMSIFTAAIGMLFSSSGVVERQYYIIAFYVVQAIYLGVALRETARDVRIIRARDFARARVFKFLPNAGANGSRASNRGLGLPWKPRRVPSTLFSDDGDLERETVAAVSPDEIEIFDTFRGDVLGAWAASSQFSAKPQTSVGDLLALNGLVAPFVSDESHTNNFSRSVQAKFYRHLIDSFPMMVDMLVDLPKQKWEAVRTLFESLSTEYGRRRSTPGGGVIAEAIEGIDQSSVAYFLVKCKSANDRETFRKVVLELVNSHPKFRAKRRTYLMVCAARTIQRAWISRKMRITISSNGPQRSTSKNSVTSPKTKPKHRSEFLKGAASAVSI